MFVSQHDPIRILKASITGERAIDQETLTSVAVLAERLERLKKTSSLFSDITFSRDVQQLADCRMTPAIS